MCDVSAFRDGMSLVATPVHLITTDGAAGLGGCTASAVTSVTAEPPTLMVCLNESSSAAGLIQGNGCFNVNTLAADDEDLSEVFAGRAGVSGAERFRFGSWLNDEGECPILLSALAVFRCRVAEVRKVSTHYLIMGEIFDVRQGRVRDALVYHNRSYRRTAANIAVSMAA